jgi:hypothetical protein
VTAEIRLYIEGGGDHKDTRIRLRTAFGEFLKEVREKARAKAIRWDIKLCGARGAALHDFALAVKSCPGAFNVLLVDAEGPVTVRSPWEHLRNRKEDQWKNPGAADNQCHLMVQMMEAWLIADREKLAGYYGKGFHGKSLPDNPNVEQIDERALEESLARATRQTTKGLYHKTRHAPDILERIRPEVVRPKASYCDRLFKTLIAEIERPA